jgi:hypothetical protein
MIVQNIHPGSCVCYRCKLNSLTFDRGRPKTHVKKGDPWKDNPVAERIEELKKVGARYEEQGKTLKMATISQGEANADL